MFFKGFVVILLFLWLNCSIKGSGVRIVKKSLVIATCLYNSSFVNSLDQGETRIAEIFAEHFNGHSFERWNSELSHKVSEKIISTVGRSSRINVKYFIEDLWDY